MSRSRKHTPRCGDKKSQYAKRMANHLLRRADIMPGSHRGAYRKYYCQYNICDFEEVGVTFEQYWHSNRFMTKRSDLRQAYQEYLKFYIRK